MKDKEDILIERLAIVAAVISFVITVGILIAAGSPRKGKAVFIILYITTFIAVCIIYFLSRGIYKVLKWSYAQDKFYFRLMVMLSSLISIPIGVIYGIDSINRFSNPDTVLIYFGIVPIANPIVAFFMSFSTNAIIVFILIFTAGYIIRWVYNRLKWIYVRHKFFFRLMVVLSSLISIPIGMIYGINMVDHDVSWGVLGIIRITNPIVIFLMFFAACALITFIPIFTTGQVLYLAIRWVRSGSKGSQFYFRLTVVLSIVSSIIGPFIAAVDVSQLTDHPVVRMDGIVRFISYYGVKETIAAIDVNPSITSVLVAAVCGAGVWIIYLSTLWIYRGLDSDDEE